LKIEFRKQHTRLVSWIVFLITLAVVLIAVTAALFPALVIRTMGGVVEFSGIDPFMTGLWTYPILIANLVLLGLAILFYKNKMPKQLTKSIRFIFNFEISTHVAVISILVLIGIYIAFTVGELSEEELWADRDAVEPAIEKWSIYDISGFDLHARMFLLSTSLNVFGNSKIIPFIASISLLLLTYFTTTAITKKRFAGIVSMIIVMQSGLFLIYDTSTTYTNFWILFYLLSLYVIHKVWPLSPISFILSIFSKQMTAIFLPITLFFIYRSIISRKKKILVMISYVVIIIVGVLFIFNQTSFTGGITSFGYHDFWKALNAIAYQLRFEGFLWMFLLPLTVGLFIASKKGVLHADSMMLLIMMSIISQAITSAFTYNNSEPYRFMPLIVFFAIGVGTLLSKELTNRS